MQDAWPGGQRRDPDAKAAVSTPCPGSHGEDRDQDVAAIKSNRCKTQTRPSQTPKAPADIPSRETAEGSLCIQSAHKALFSFSPQCIRDNLHLVKDSAVTAIALLLAAWMWEMEMCPAHSWALHTQISEQGDPIRSHKSVFAVGLVICGVWCLPLMASAVWGT